MRPILTIVLIEDAEKDPVYTERFLFGVRALNADALDRIELVAVTQRRDSRLGTLLADDWCQAVVIEADEPRADDGYPIWDICAEMRRVWPYIRGSYVTCAHTEFFFGPGRLARTCRWLADHRPVMALGNLRRIGVDEPHWKNRLLKPGPGVSDILQRWIDERRTQMIVGAWDQIETTHWCHWHASPTSDGTLDEDVFYARKDWIETLRLFEHDRRQAYQDVYDLWRAAYARLMGANLAPPCPRLSRPDNDIYHLDHPRQRQAFSLACYRYFLAHRDQWEGRSYARDEVWAQMLNPGVDVQDRHRAITEFRHGRDGTVTRFAIAFHEWVKAGGEQQVDEYLAAQCRGQHDNGAEEVA